MIYVALGAFVLLADRVARADAEYPLTDSTNWRTPSG